MNKKSNRSIAFKLIITFSIMAVVQNLLMLALLIYGGVLEQSKKNAYQIFAEKVDGRKNNLENEMNHVWTNFDHYTDQIRQYYTELNMEGDKKSKTSEEILEDLAPVVMDTLYFTKATGVYLILNEESGSKDSYAALYLRNLDPTRLNEKSYNTYLMAGPWSVAEKLKIVTDVKWSPQLKLNDSNRAFYDKPYSSRELSDDSHLLGYWCPPFSPFSGDDEVITYSIPLTDKQDNFIGVFGVEIAVNYLYKFMPYTDLQADDSYGYAIGIQSGKNKDMQAAITRGALQKRLFKDSDPLHLQPVEEGSSVSRLVNSTNQSDIYISSGKLGLYYNNTPFSSEEWYLMGIMKKDELLYFPEKVNHILLMALAVSMGAGLVIAVVTGKSFTQFSRLMELSEVPLGAFEFDNRKRRVFMTSQIASLLKLSREQEREFTKNKDKFLDYLTTICQNPTDESNIFALPPGIDGYWLRITWKDKDGMVRGVVEDVTDEILQKKALMKERDYDELTGVKNRKGFQRLLDQLNNCLEKENKIAVVMCDLNELKHVNDSLGHIAGDEYLRYSAKAICESFPCRPVFRIGGDEFVILIENITRGEIEACKAVLLEKMENYNLGEDFHTGIAIGYAIFEKEKDQNLEDVLTRADAIMYINKKEHRN